MAFLFSWLFLYHKEVTRVFSSSLNFAWQFYCKFGRTKFDTHTVLCLIARRGPDLFNYTVLLQVLLSSWRSARKVQLQLGANFGKSRGWGGGVIRQIPSVGVVWIFSGTTHFYKSTCSDWLIDLCVLPTGRMPWIIWHLWEFLCVRDAGCRGNKITVYVSKNDFSKLYKWYNSCHGNWLMQFLNNVSTENEISTLRCDL